MIGSGNHKALISVPYVGRAEKACASKAVYKPDSVVQVLSGGMGKNSSKMLWEA